MNNATMNMGMQLSLGYSDFISLCFCPEVGLFDLWQVCFHFEDPPYGFS